MIWTSGGIIYAAFCVAFVWLTSLWSIQVSSSSHCIAMFTVPCIIYHQPHPHLIFYSPFSFSRFSYGITSEEVHLLFSVHPSILAQRPLSLGFHSTLLLLLLPLWCNIIIVLQSSAGGSLFPITLWALRGQGPLLSFHPVPCRVPGGSQ